jgi:hypothetical protein
LPKRNGSGGRGGALSVTLKLTMEALAMTGEQIALATFARRTDATYFPA